MGEGFFESLEGGTESFLGEASLIGEGSFFAGGSFVGRGEVVLVGVVKRGVSLLFLVFSLLSLVFSLLFLVVSLSFLVFSLLSLVISLSFLDTSFDRRPEFRLYSPERLSSVSPKTGNPCTPRESGDTGDPILKKSVAGDFALDLSGEVITEEAGEFDADDGDDGGA